MLKIFRKYRLFVLLAIVALFPSQLVDGAIRGENISFSESTLEVDELLGTIEHFIGLLNKEKTFGHIGKNLTDCLESANYSQFALDYNEAVSSKIIQYFDDAISFLSTAQDLEVSTIKLNEIVNHLKGIFYTIDNFSISGSAETVHQYLITLLSEIYTTRDILKANFELMKRTGGDAVSKCNHIYRAQACTFLSYLSQHLQKLVTIYYKQQPEINGNCGLVRKYYHKATRWQRDHKIALRRVFFGTLAFTSLVIPIVKYLESQSSSTKVSALEPVGASITGAVGNCTIALQNTVNITSSQTGAFTAALTTLDGLAAVFGIFNELVRGAENIETGFREDLFNAYVTAMGLLDVRARNLIRVKRRRRSSSSSSSSSDDARNRRRTKRPDDGAGVSSTGQVGMSATSTTLGTS